MQEIDPKETTRAYAFDMWMNAPMPMVTFLKTLDVSRLVRISRRYVDVLVYWACCKSGKRILYAPG